MKNAIYNGKIVFEAINKNNKNFAKKIFYEGSSRLSPAIYLDNSGIATFYMVHIGGGYVENERYGIESILHENSHIILTNQAPTQIYKCENGGYSSLKGSFFLKENATLEFLNDSLILFENSSFKQNFNFYLTRSSTLFYTEILTPGYSSDLKHFSFWQGRLKSRIFIDDELVCMDFLNLKPKEYSLENLCFLEGFSHIATLNFFSPNISNKLIEPIKNLIKHLDKKINFGISQPLSSAICIRVLGNSTDELQYLSKHIYNFLRKEILGLRGLDVRK